MAVLVDFESSASTDAAFQKMLKAWEKTAAKTEKVDLAFRHRELEAIGIAMIRDGLRVYGMPASTLNDKLKAWTADPGWLRKVREGVESIMPPWDQKSLAKLAKHPR